VEMIPTILVQNGMFMASIIKWQTRKGVKPALDLFAGIYRLSENKAKHGVKPTNLTKLVRTD